MNVYVIIYLNESLAMKTIKTVALATADDYGYFVLANTKNEQAVTSRAAESCSHAL